MAYRILGTPNEQVWPGVSQLPDYKETFPQWSRQSLHDVVRALDDTGIDLLSVSANVVVVRLSFVHGDTQRTLTYDTAKRISGK